MALGTVRNDLLAIARAHNEPDGGYGLVSALCAYRSQMLESMRSQWDEVLLGWVQEEAPSLWGVALEALVRAGGTMVNAELSRILHGGERSAQWREYVAYALIRRGCADETVRMEAEQGARGMSPMGLSNLAGLLVIAPELLGTAIDCVATAMSSGHYDYVRANLPPFVYAAADSDAELLVRMVERISERDLENGKRFAAMVADYLKKPFIQKRIGADVAAKLSAVLLVSTRTRN